MYYIPSVYLVRLALVFMCNVHITTFYIEFGLSINTHLKQLAFLIPDSNLKLNQVGYDITPTEETPLCETLSYGLEKHIEQLEEISGVASKEYALEKAMQKMKSEWADVCFVFIPYRDTGVSILSSVEDIQMLLDDHIVKVQTMRSSPFIGPFEAEFKEWEAKLQSMQDIIDEWLKVQATWLYLEPIFSSEDIMQQMPEEGDLF